MAPDRQLQSSFSLPEPKGWQLVTNAGLEIWASSDTQPLDEPTAQHAAATGATLPTIGGVSLIKVGASGHLWITDVLGGGAHSLGPDSEEPVAASGVHLGILEGTSAAVLPETPLEHGRDSASAVQPVSFSSPLDDRHFDFGPPVRTFGADERTSFHLDAPAAETAQPDIAHAGGSVDTGSSHDGGMDWAGLDANSGGGSSLGSGSGSTGSGGTILSSYTSGSATVADSLEYNIKLIFSGSGWTTATQNMSIWAANWLSALVTGDTHDDTSVAADHHFIDDLEITMTIGSIDRGGNILTGNTLAQTTLTSWRTPGTTDQYLPVEAKIKLDAYDFKTQASWWDDVLLHEMTHALGFSGNVFQGLHLLDAAGNFIGSKAAAAYGAASVPIESTGGTGTAGSHWSETAFAPGGVAAPNELMTGYVSLSQATVMTDTTVGALQDLGYHVVDPSPTATYYAVNSGLLIV